MCTKLCFRDTTIMKTVTFTEFRKNVSLMIDDVEKGNIIRILRHGKPVAELTPLSPESTEMPSWKRPGLKLSAKGISLSETILEERKPL